MSVCPEVCLDPCGPSPMDCPPDCLDSWILVEAIPGALAQAVAALGPLHRTLFLAAGTHVGAHVPADVTLIFEAGAVLSGDGRTAVGAPEIRGEIVAGPRRIFDLSRGPVRVFASAAAVALADWWLDIGSLIASTDHNDAPTFVRFGPGEYLAGGETVPRGQSWMGEGTTLRRRRSTLGAMLRVDAPGSPRVTALRGFVFDRDPAANDRLPVLSAGARPGRAFGHGALLAVAAGTDLALEACTFFDPPAGTAVTMGPGARLSAERVCFARCETAVSARNSRGVRILAEQIEAVGCAWVLSVGPHDLQDAPTEDSAGLSVVLRDVQSDGALGVALGAGGRLTVSDSRFGGMSLVTSADSQTQLMRCRFTPLPGQQSTIRYAIGVSMRECRFHAPIAGVSALHIDFGSAGQTRSVLLAECRFDGREAGEPLGTALLVQAGETGLGNLLMLRGGHVSAHYARGVLVGPGVRAIVSGVGFSCGDAIHLFGATEDRVRTRLQVNGCSWNGAGAALVVDPRQRATTVEHTTTVLQAAHNSVEPGPAAVVYRGMREILAGRGPTATDTGLPGDVWRLQAPPVGETFEWVCAGAAQGRTRWRAVQCVLAP